MKPIYLTAAERTMFSDAAWSVKEERDVLAEAQDEMLIRYSLLRLQDPGLRAVQEKMRTARTKEDMLALVRGLDLSALHEDDLAELYFAMGPAGLSALITGLLHDRAPTESIAAFTEIRHRLLAS